MNWGSPESIIAIIGGMRDRHGPQQLDQGPPRLSGRE